MHGGGRLDPRVHGLRPLTVGEEAPEIERLRSRLLLGRSQRRILERVSLIFSAALQQHAMHCLLLYSSMQCCAAVAEVPRLRAWRVPAAQLSRRRAFSGVCCFSWRRVARSPSGVLLPAMALRQGPLLPEQNCWKAPAEGNVDAISASFSDIKHFQGKFSCS